MLNSVKSVKQEKPRIIFFGMQGHFSIPSLQALLDNSIEVCAVVVPNTREHGQAHIAISPLEPPHRSRALLPVRGSSLHDSIVQVAWQRGIPVYEARRLRDTLTVTTLTSFAPDIICVACFPRKLPRAVLDIPRLGCLNVHPSLLPDNRGPEPIFWTFRRGDTETGVTIHLLDDGMDSGDILAQAKLPVPDGIDYMTLEAQLAYLGGTLLAQTVLQLSEGQAVRLPQNKIGNHHLPFPGKQDFIVPVATWDARHVYNFLRGVAGFGEPLYLQVGDKLTRVEQAMSYDLALENRTPEDESFRGNAREGVWIRCSTGWVRVKPASSQ
jgi:methionyl-tRNA formyltransferase